MSGSCLGRAEGPGGGEPARPGGAAAAAGRGAGLRAPGGAGQPLGGTEVSGAALPSLESFVSKPGGGEGQRRPAGAGSEGRVSAAGGAGAGVAPGGFGTRGAKCPRGNGRQGARLCQVLCFCGFSSRCKSKYRFFPVSEKSSLRLFNRFFLHGFKFRITTAKTKPTL